MQEIKIRDIRKKGWFIIDNKFIDLYAKELKTAGILVYMSLCRHADNYTQECYPSIKLIAEEHGVSKDTVLRAIKKLEEFNIIKVEREIHERENGVQKRNRYLLLDQSVWVQGSKNATLVAGSQIEVEQGSKIEKSRVAPEVYKDTHINNTHIKETHIAGEPAKIGNLIGEVIKEMESLDPKNKMYYNNTTQRSATKFLIETYGFEIVLEMIRVIPQLKSTVPYFPSVTTPCELRDKWQKIGDAVTRSKVKRKAEVIDALDSVIY